MMSFFCSFSAAVKTVAACLAIGVMTGFCLGAQIVGG